MPTTWWNYGLYGFIELTRPHWFGWWSVLLVVCIGVLLWLFFYKEELEEHANEIKQNRNRSAEFQSTTTLEWITKLMLERSWTYKAAIPLWVTLLVLQNKRRWRNHKQFLTQLERTLYDVSYVNGFDSEELKKYLTEHTFFDWLTTSWIVK